MSELVKSRRCSPASPTGCSIRRWTFPALSVRVFVGVGVAAWTTVFVIQHRKYS